MKDMGIKLDNKTPLLNFEQPENSIEPQKNRGLTQQKVTNGMIVQHLKKVVLEVINGVLTMAQMTKALLIKIKMPKLN